MPPNLLILQRPLPSNSSALETFSHKRRLETSLLLMTLQHQNP